MVHKPHLHSIFSDFPDGGRATRDVRRQILFVAQSTANVTDVYASSDERNGAGKGVEAEWNDLAVSFVSTARQFGRQLQYDLTVCPEEIAPEKVMPRLYLTNYDQCQPSTTSTVVKAPLVRASLVKRRYIKYLAFFWLFLYLTQSSCIHLYPLLLSTLYPASATKLSSRLHNTASRTLLRTCICLCIRRHVEGYELLVRLHVSGGNAG